MNPIMMAHPMHLHHLHFQVVDLGRRRFNGPLRQMVTVQPGSKVTAAVDFNKPGDWSLRCNHLSYTPAEA